MGTIWCSWVGAVLGDGGLLGSWDEAQGCISALVTPDGASNPFQKKQLLLSKPPPARSSPTTFFILESHAVS